MGLIDLDSCPLTYAVEQHPVIAPRVAEALSAAATARLARAGHGLARNILA
jgi:hypothetical protein